MSFIFCENLRTAFFHLCRGVGRLLVLSRFKSTPIGYLFRISAIWFGSSPRSSRSDASDRLFRGVLPQLSLLTWIFFLNLETICEEPEIKFCIFRATGVTHNRQRQFFFLSTTTNIFLVPKFVFLCLQFYSA